MGIRNVEITVTFKLLDDLVTQDDLDNWNGKNEGITLEEYVKFMVADEGMLFDITDGIYTFVSSQS